MRSRDRDRAWLCGVAVVGCALVSLLCCRAPAACADPAIAAHDWHYSHPFAVDHATGGLVACVLRDQGPARQDDLIVLGLPDATTHLRVPAGGRVVSGLQWARDGTRVGYAVRIAGLGQSRIRVLNVETGEVRHPPDDVPGRDPVLSPDGSRVYFSRGGIYSCWDVAGSASPRPAGFSGIVRTPSRPWSCDGRLFFRSNSDGAGLPVGYVVASIDATGSVVNTRLRGAIVGPVQFDRQGLALATVAAQSPVWTDERELWVLDSATGVPRRLARGRFSEYTDWTADGSAVIVARREGDSDTFVLSVVDVVTGALSDLGLASGEVVEGVWPQTTLDPAGVVFSWRNAAWLYTYRDRRAVAVFDALGRTSPEAGPVPPY